MCPLQDILELSGVLCSTVNMANLTRSLPQGLPGPPGPKVSAPLGVDGSFRRSVPRVSAEGETQRD